MAAGDRIITRGIVPERLYEQEGSTFTENEFGFDEGMRRFLTHPGTPKIRWPQRDQPDAEWSKMFVRDVIERADESGLIELTVYYRGVMRFTSGEMKVQISPTADISMVSLPGDGATYIATIPVPRATRQFLTTTPPTLTGVAATFNAPWLPAAPAFSLTYVPDPNNPTIQLTIGWKLDSRTWESIADQVFLVSETATLYYPIG